MINYEKIFKSLEPSLIEVTLPDNETFLKVAETLTRIGHPKKADEFGKQALEQICYILHKRGKYYIAHIKEMCLLDGRIVEFTDKDRGKRNRIANLLSEWGLVKIKNLDIATKPMAEMREIKVVKYADRDKWDLFSRYRIGQNKL